MNSEKTKADLMRILREPNDKLIAVDLDGTLCFGEFWGGKEVEPNTEMIALVSEWYRKGAHIIIYTARQAHMYRDTHAWLLKHGVPFHGICMQMKPGADLYIDDKGLHVDDVKLSTADA